MGAPAVENSQAAVWVRGDQSHKSQLVVPPSLFSPMILGRWKTCVLERGSLFLPSGSRIGKEGRVWAEMLAKEPGVG